MRDWLDLVRKAQAGDLAAFDAVVEDFRDMAVGYAYSVLQDFHLAEDAAQEAFVQTYRDLKMLREPRAFPAWFRRVVFKHCDRLSRRRALPTVPVEAAPEAPDRAPDPFEELQRREAREAVLSGIRGLPDHERTAVALYYIDGYSMAEVGEFLEVPAARVKSRLHSARRKLRERMMAMVEATLKSHAPGAELNQKVRRVLEGVPLVSFELHLQEKKDGLRRCPEGHPFPSCLRACLEYLGEGMGFREITAHGGAWRLDTTYVYLMGTTGAAFKLTWKPGWHMDNPDLSHLPGDPLAPVRRGLESVARRYEVVVREAGRDDEALFRRRILESIRDRELPVIAQGVVGPPVDCLITGFDEAGDVLIGWSFFRLSKELAGDVQYEPGGTFRKRGWFPDTHRLILLGEGRERPPLREVYRDSLRWALEIARTPVAPGDRQNGLAAYQAWAAEILRDEEFRGRTREELRHRYHVHQDAVGTVAEGRWYAHNFLRKVLEDTQAPAALEEAARCYDDEHSLMWQVWGLVGGPGDSDQTCSLFAEPQVRRKTAEIILAAREKDRQAAASLEKAVAQW